MLRINCEIVKSVTLLNLVPGSHALVRTEMNFLSRSFDRPTIKEVAVTWNPQSREIEKFGKGTEGETNNEYENQIEVL